MKTCYIKDNISFNAKPGNKLIKRVTKEFNGNKTRIDKYITLFEDTFKKNTDDNTIIDIDKNNNYIFSNTKFPGIKYYYPSYISSLKPISQQVLNECTKTISNGEISLFRNIIARHFAQDKTLKNIMRKAETENVSQTFMEQLEFAKKIINKNPNSELSNVEFEAELIESMKGNLPNIVNSIFK